MLLLMAAVVFFFFIIFSKVKTLSLRLSYRFVLLIESCSSLIVYKFVYRELEKL